MLNIPLFLVWSFWFPQQTLYCCWHGGGNYQLVVSKFLIALLPPHNWQTLCLTLWALEGHLLYEILVAHRILVHWPLWDILSCRCFHLYFLLLSSSSRCLSTYSWAWLWDLMLWACRCWCHLRGPWLSWYNPTCSSPPLPLLCLLSFQ